MRSSPVSGRVRKEGGILFRQLRYFFGRLTKHYGLFRSILVAILAIEIIVLPIIQLTLYSIQNAPTAASKLDFSAIPPVALTAKACLPKLSLECSVSQFDEGLPLYGVPQSVIEAIPDEAAATHCTEKLVNQLNEAKTTELPLGYSVTKDVILGNCNLKLVETYPSPEHPGANYYNFEGNLSLTLPGGSYPTAYNYKNWTATGDQIFSATLGYAKARIISTIYKSVSSSIWFSDFDSNGDLGQVFDLSGDFSGPITLNLDAKQSLTEYLVSSDTIEIDSSSFWEIKTSGQAKVEISFSFVDGGRQDGDITITNSSFCLTTCIMTTEEVQYIKATKLPVDGDTVAGELTSRLDYTDTYTGTGSVDKKSLSAKWNSDLKIDKTRELSWSNDLNEACPSNPSQIIADWQYDGEIITNAIHLPLQKNKVEIEDTVKKNLNFTDTDLRTLIKGGGDKCDGLAKSGAAAIDKKETSIRIDGQPEALTRSGPGSASFNQAAINYSMSCVNDEFDPRCLIVRSTDPKETETPTRKDPFGNVGEYTKSYLADQFNVEGLFTVSFGDADESVIKTDEVKELPKIMVITNSFGPEDSDKYKIDEAIDAIKQEAERHKVEVLVSLARSKLAFVSAINDVKGKSGVAWMHFGHGAPTGLLFPDDSTEISFAELTLFLENARINFSVVAGYSCYFGHIPLSNVLSSNLGVGVGVKIPGHFGENFGIGKHTVQSARAFMVNQVVEVFDLCK